MKITFHILIIALLFRCPVWADNDARVHQVEKPTVAILILQNATGDTNLAHWRKSLARVLEYQLSEVRSIRIIPYTSRDYAYRALKLEPGQLVTATEVRKLGQIMQAQKVVWGDFQRKGEDWKFTLKVMNTADDKISDPLTSSSIELTHACLEMSQKVFLQMGIHPSSEEVKAMGVHFHTSNKAIESWSRTSKAADQGAPMSEIQLKVKHALELDPSFFEAHYLLAQALMFGGKLDEAKSTLKEQIKVHPNFAPFHQLLGAVYLYQELLFSAQEELLEAVRLDSDDPENHLRLSEIYGKQEKYDLALTSLKRAESLAPYDVSIHAKLALTYISLKQPDKALVALAKAEAYQLELQDPEAEGLLASAYEFLHEPAQAVQHYEKFLAAAKQVGAESAIFDQAEKSLAEQKARLVPQFIEAATPQMFSRKELENKLKAMLTPREYKLVTYPLNSSSEIESWARTLVGEASTEQEKALRLFYGLTRHIDLDYQASKRTALETFQDWPDPHASFRCQEYTFLYVALAREVGLKAFYVWVDKDYRGRFVPHACAGVFVGGKALLIDPTYHWFGVPHEKVEFKNDLEVVALYLGQLSDIAKGRVAIKLMPDSSYIRFNQAIVLAHAKRFTMARQALQRGLAIDSTSWLALYAQGVIEGSEKNWESAADHLKQCLSLDPEFPAIHFRMGVALGAQGKLTESRDEFRAYLAAAPKGELASQAWDFISKVDEALRALKGVAR